MRMNLPLRSIAPAARVAAALLPALMLDCGGEIPVDTSGSGGSAGSSSSSSSGGGSGGDTGGAGSSAGGSSGGGSGGDTGGAGSSTGGSSGGGSGGDTGGAGSSTGGGSGGGPQPCAQPSLPGVLGFTHVFSGSGQVRQGQGVALDAAGNIYVAGSFDGAIDLGGGPLTSAGDNDVFVAKLDAGGNHLWSKHFGSVGEDNGMGIAIDAAGNIVVLGGFTGTIDLGGGPLVDGETFLAKLDATGGHLWSRALDSGASTMALDSAGDILLTTGQPGHYHDFNVQKVNAMGQLVFSKDVYGPWITESESIAVDGADNIFVTGVFGQPPGGGYGAGGTIQFGNTSLTTGYFSSFIVKLDPAGNDLWSSKTFDPGTPIAFDVAVDPSGGLVLASIVSSQELLVERLDPQGQLLWSRQDIAGGTPGLVTGVKVDAAGHAFVMTKGVVITALDLCSGETLWSTNVGDGSGPAGFHMAIDGSSTVVVTGATNIQGNIMQPWKADALLTKLTY